jgi:hypothetical protein
VIGLNDFLFFCGLLEMKKFRIFNLKTNNNNVNRLFSLLPSFTNREGGSLVVVYREEDSLVVAYPLAFLEVAFRVVRIQEEACPLVAYPLEACRNLVVVLLYPWLVPLTFAMVHQLHALDQQGPEVQPPMEQQADLFQLPCPLLGLLAFLCLHCRGEVGLPLIRKQQFLHELIQDPMCASLHALLIYLPLYS